MRMPKRVIVKEQIASIGIYDIPSKLEDFIERLQGINSKDHTNITVDTEGLDYEGPDTIVFYGERTENDKEYNLRIEREKKQRERNKQEKMDLLQRTEAQISKLQKEVDKLRKQTEAKTESTNVIKV